MSTSTFTETLTINRLSSSPFSPASLRKRHRSTHREEAIKPYKLPSPSRGRRSAVTRNSITQATPHEAEEVKPVVTPFSAAGSPSDQLNNFLGQEAGCNIPAAATCNKVLRFITQRNRKIYSAAFRDITEEVYNRISCIIETLPQKPRLAYNRDTLKLTVDMPSSVHEAVMKVLSPGMEHVDAFLRSLLSGTWLDSDSHTNLTIKAEGFECIPDLAHIITALSDPPLKAILVVCEVALSQPRASILQKFRDIIEAYPGIVMLFMIDIAQVQYQAPKTLSAAWKTLRLEEKARSEPSFLSIRTGERSLNQPMSIVVEEHSWCALSSVYVKVWVRGDHPINVDTQDPALVASGDLFPTKTIDDVTVMIEKGLSLMRNRYADLALHACPNIDLTALRTTHIPSPFSWDHMLSKLALASMTLAHERYVNWYDVVPKGRCSADKTLSTNEGPWMYTRSRTGATRGSHATLGRGRLLRRHRG
ncbi:hypothetical protein EDB19DRAFT_1835828 [Suillus lakei]|nr:hypothetical protein EDB19DRAFT_1835828 [Suillus lakei]